MRTLGLCTSALLVISLRLGAANEVNQLSDSGPRSWSRLQRDAGYFTESGKWRGGLYRRNRSTETEHYRCLDHTDTHCTNWNVSEHSSKRYETRNCECEETASPFCQSWTCNTHWDSLPCHCMAAAKNGRYCWKWHCRELKNIVYGIYIELQDYECLVGDISGEFCFRWHGNTSSKYEVESSVCQCFERGQSFCEHWMCRERGIRRCSQSGAGWCRLKIAIGVGGGMGLLSFVLVLVCCADEIRLGEFNAVLVVICFAIFGLPWLVGVAIWRGVFGFPWVLLMWGVALGSVVCGIRRGNSRRGLVNMRHPRVQLATLSVGRTQVVDSGEWRR